MRIDDTTTDTRGPRWNEAVQRLGVRSVLSARLLAAEESIGAMKVYYGQPAQGATSRQEAFSTLAAAARRTDRTFDEVARALLDAMAARNTERTAG